MNIEFTDHPNSSDIEFITRKINEEVEGLGCAYPFAFFIRNKTADIIAGCNGSVIFGCIYTDQLWVNKNFRNQGLGTQLMDAVHHYGKKSGCQFATVSTMSFQGAQAFYEKLGYQVDFQRNGYVANSSCLFLRKNL